MNNKLFNTLVTILSILIFCATAWLVISVIEYKHVINPDSTNNEELLKPERTNNVQTTNVSQYILPSDSKVIVRSDLLNYDLDTLNKAYNEIFARHGHDFKSQDLKEYFNKQSWYKAIPGKSVAVSELTELEYKNTEVIKARIDEIKK